MNTFVINNSDEIGCGSDITEFSLVYECQPWVFGATQTLDPGEISTNNELVPSDCVGQGEELPISIQLSEIGCILPLTTASEVPCEGECQIGASFSSAWLQGNTFQFTNTSTSNPSNLSVSFYWDFGFTTTTVENPIVTFPGPGNYFITFIVYSTEDPSCFGTISGQVPIVEEQDCCELFPSFTFEFLDEPFCQTVQFTNTTIGLCSETEFLWEFGDGETSTEENPIHEFEGYVGYIVTLTISFEGCSNSVVDYIIAGECYPHHGGDEGGIHISAKNGTGEDFLTDIFPNPASEKVTVELTSPVDELGIMTVYDVAGRTVYTKEIYLDEGTLNRTEFY